MSSRSEQIVKEETQHLALVDKYLPKNGPAMIGVEGEPIKPAYTYLPKNGVPTELVYDVYDKNTGKIKPRIQNGENLLKIHSTKISQYLENAFTTPYQVADRLLKIFDFTFNYHTDPHHLQNGHKWSRKLYKDAQLYGERKKDLLKYDAWQTEVQMEIHDIGCMADRNVHHLLGYPIATQIVPDFLKLPDRVQIDISEGVKSHRKSGVDEKLKLLQKKHPLTNHDLLLKDDKGNITNTPNADGEVRLMRDHFSVAELITNIADQVDVDPKRVVRLLSDKNRVDEALKKKDLELNLLLKTAYVGVDPKNPQKILWQLLFNGPNSFTPQEQQEHAEFIMPSKNGGTRARVAKDTHELHKKHSFPYRSIIDAKFWNNYLPSIKPSVQAMFALFEDWRQCVEIELIDRHFPISQEYMNLNSKEYMEPINTDKIFSGNILIKKFQRGHLEEGFEKENTAYNIG
jgi:hypothetical protein